MIGLKWFKWICCGLVLALASPPGQADEACEAFIDDALGQLLSSINRTQALDDPELETLVQTKVDTVAIAKFTLGKYAARVTAEDLHDYSSSLNAYFLEAIHDNIHGGQQLSADVLSSFDRNQRDCIVETVIHRESLEDLTVVWRVMHVEEQYRVLDMALKQNGNLIWLAIELRAQVVELYEQVDGDLDAVIRSLGIG